MIRRTPRFRARASPLAIGAAVAFAVVVALGCSAASTSPVATDSASAGPRSSAPGTPSSPVNTPVPEPTPLPRATLGNFASAVAELERLGLECLPPTAGDVFRTCSDEPGVVILRLTPSERRLGALEEYAGTVDLSRADAPESRDAFVAALALLAAIAEGSNDFVVDALMEKRTLSEFANFGNARLQVSISWPGHRLSFSLRGREITG